MPGGWEVAATRLSCAGMSALVIRVVVAVAAEEAGTSSDQREIYEEVAGVSVFLMGPPCPGEATVLSTAGLEAGEEKPKGLGCSAPLTL